MRRIGLMALAALTLSAGAAAACPDCDHADYSYSERGSAYGERGYWREDVVVHRPAPCRSGCGEVVLPGWFFYDAGGVGPIPDAGHAFFGGGSFVFADSSARAGASAFAAARASAHARAFVRRRPFGGFRGGKKH